MQQGIESVIKSEMEVEKVLENYSSSFDLSVPRVAIILAAGHGKRLKSNIPKMLFEIWGVPTILRVIQSARKDSKLQIK